MPDGEDERRVTGTFSKTITGRYYQRQADFFHRVYSERAHIERNVCPGQRNLIDLLLSRDEGFSI